jgi:hypothetical protein
MHVPLICAPCRISRQQSTHSLHATNMPAHSSPPATAAHATHLLRCSQGRNHRLLQLAVTQQLPGGLQLAVVLHAGARQGRRLLQLRRGGAQGPLAAVQVACHQQSLRGAQQCSRVVRGQGQGLLEALDCLCRREQGQGGCQCSASQASGGGASA